jgi:hypothetical protein
MMRQTVRPAGTRSETLWVLLTAGLVLAAAATIVDLRATPAVGDARAAHQVDARSGLTPAEQGLYADLLAAAVDIAVQAVPPSVARLAADGLPPFVRDSSWRTRGAHSWTLVETAGDHVAYLGRTGAPEVAGSLLLRLRGDGSDVWLKAAAAAPPPQADDTALIADGWRQVVSSFTAGATR